MGYSCTRTRTHTIKKIEYANKLERGSHKVNIINIADEYIDTFLKIKQATSGYPPSVKTDQDKIEFCKKFEEREGVPLAPDDVKPNPGLRSLSKLCLNR